MQKTDPNPIRAIQDNEWPLPDATNKRSSKVRQVALLYIHERVRTVKEAAERVGMNAAHLARIAKADDWDGFAARLAQANTTSVFKDATIRRIRSDEQLKLMKQECEDQVALVEKLRSSRDELVEALKITKPGTKPYASILSSLRLVRQEIEAICGLDVWRDEESFARKSAIKTDPKKAGDRPQFRDLPPLLA